MKRIIVLLVLMLVVSGCSGTTNNGNEQPADTETPVPPTATYREVPTSTYTLEPSETPTITPAPTTGIGSAQISAKDGMEMMYVPAGEFEMGSELGDDWEQPIHTVYLDAYWVDKYEVTNQQYADFLNEMGNQTEGGKTKTWLDAGSKYVRIHQTEGEWQADSGYSDHPVWEVSWYGARAYCHWASRRLPTEAEWEKAARGEDRRPYPWGEGISCSQASYSGCEGDTKPVGSYPGGASPYGALDMAGNVWEWVADWYDENYYSNSPSENPQGPSSGYFRVMRGGSWNFTVWYVRSAYRLKEFPIYSGTIIGFRCVLSP